MHFLEKLIKLLYHQGSFEDKCISNFLRKAVKEVWNLCFLNKK